MEIPGTSSTTQSQATSSSVIVQSNHLEEGITLSSLTDIQQLHQQRHPNQSTIGSQIPYSSHLQGHSSQITTSNLQAARSSSFQQASSSSTSSPLLSPIIKKIFKNMNNSGKTKH